MPRKSNRKPNRQSNRKPNRKLLNNKGGNPNNIRIKGINGAVVEIPQVWISDMGKTKKDCSTDTYSTFGFEPIFERPSSKYGKKLQTDKSIWFSIMNMKDKGGEKIYSSEWKDSPVSTWLKETNNISCVGLINPKARYLVMDDKNYDIEVARVANQKTADKSRADAVIINTREYGYDISKSLIVRDVNKVFPQGLKEFKLSNVNNKNSNKNRNNNSNNGYNNENKDDEKQPVTVEVYNSLFNKQTLGNNEGPSGNIVGSSGNNAGSSRKNAMNNNLKKGNNSQDRPSGESQMYEKSLFRVEYSKSDFGSLVVHIVANNEEEAKVLFIQEYFIEEEEDEDLHITKYSLKVITNSNEPYQLHSSFCEGGKMVSE